MSCTTSFESKAMTIMLPTPNCSSHSSYLQGAEAPPTLLNDVVNTNTALFLFFPVSVDRDERKT